MKDSIKFRVEAPQDQAFEFLSDLENAPQWVPDLVSVDKITEGDIRVGTKYKEVVQMGKKKGDADLEITEWNPPHSFAHQGTGGPSRFTAKFTFEPDGTGTQITHDYTVKMTGLFWFLSPLINGWIKKNASAGIENIKKLLFDTSQSPPES